MSTLYGWKARAEKIREDAAASKPGAKSSKGSEFDEVSAACCTVLNALLSDDDEVHSGGNGQGTQPKVPPRPKPYADVATQIGDLEEEAERCSMNEVTYHLRKEKLAWMHELGSKKTKKTRMREFL